MIMIKACTQMQSHSEQWVDDRKLRITGPYERGMPSIGPLKVVKLLFERNSTPKHVYFLSFESIELERK